VVLLSACSPARLTAASLAELAGAVTAPLTAAICCTKSAAAAGGSTTQFSARCCGGREAGNACLYVRYLLVLETVILQICLLL
jgi:hypothetical protein